MSGFNVIAFISHENKALHLQMSHQPRSSVRCLVPTSDGIWQWYDVGDVILFVYCYCFYLVINFAKLDCRPFLIIIWLITE